MDPLQWMGAVRMIVQTADKNTVIHNSIPSINVHNIDSLVKDSSSMRKEICMFTSENSPKPL